MTLLGTVMLAGRPFAQVAGPEHAGRMGIRYIELLFDAQEKAREMIQLGYKTVKVAVRTEGGEVIALLSGPDFEYDVRPLHA